MASCGPASGAWIGGTLSWWVDERSESIQARPLYRSPSPHRSVWDLSPTSRHHRLLPEWQGGLPSHPLPVLVAPGTGTQATSEAPGAPSRLIPHGDRGAMSQPEPRCFFDDRPASQTPLFLIQGIYRCQAHSRCGHCRETLLETSHPLSCVCANYGVSAHEDALFCSDECLEASHPEVWTS